jgi:hypothetical protein
MLAFASIFSDAAVLYPDTPHMPLKGAILLIVSQTCHGAGRENDLRRASENRQNQTQQRSPPGHSAILRRFCD